MTRRGAGSQSQNWVDQVMELLDGENQSAWVLLSAAMSHQSGSNLLTKGSEVNKNLPPSRVRREVFIDLTEFCYEVIQTLRVLKFKVGQTL